MAMSRSFGGTLLTTRSPILISPEVIFSRPAIIRSSVDLPQPDGPTSTTNSPSPISTLTPWMTSMAPKALRTSRIATAAIPFLPAWAGALRPFGPRRGVPLGPRVLFFRSRPNHVAGGNVKASAIRRPALVLWWGLPDGILPPGTPLTSLGEYRMSGPSSARAEAGPWIAWILAQGAEMPGHKDQVLLIPPPRPVIFNGLTPAFDLVKFSAAKDSAKFFAETAPRLRAIACAVTSEQVDGDFMTRFPNPQIVSSFAVAYHHPHPPSPAPPPIT